MAQAEFLDYQAAPDVLQGLSPVEFFAVSGVSGAGKSSVMDEAVRLDPELFQVITTSSRALRPGERQDIDIHIRPEAEMRQRITDRGYVQVAPHILGAIYATAPEDYPPSGPCVLPVVTQALSAFMALPFRKFTSIYILPPDLQELGRRLVDRNFDADQRHKREAEMAESFRYASTHPMAFIIANELTDSAEEFNRILAGEQPRVSIETGQELAKKLLSELPEA
jgi:guanylate kinase